MRRYGSSWSSIECPLCFEYLFKHVLCSEDGHEYIVLGCYYCNLRYDSRRFDLNELVDAGFQRETRRR